MVVHNIQLDKTGFPMIWVEEINAFLHFLPVTTVQFEYYICDTLEFDESRYLEVLDNNERIHPRRASINNYWQIFLTNIKPREVERFAEWYGEDYLVPTFDEWIQAYFVLKSLPASDDLWTNVEMQNLKIPKRPQMILEKIDDITKRMAKINNRSLTLADQMLMRYGVMEWVRIEHRQGEWGGMGQTNSGFRSVMRTPDSRNPDNPHNIHDRRLFYYGCRLLKR
jgi:hypothetical protein